MKRKEILDAIEETSNRSNAKIARLVNLPVEVASAGCKVFDSNGIEYLNCGGYGTQITGAKHPKIVEAVKRQLDIHPMSTRVMPLEITALASTAMSSASPIDDAFVWFCNSGTEAVEAAIKLACLNGTTRFITMERGYHGKTIGSLSLTGRERFRGPFGDFTFDAKRVPFGSISHVAEQMTGGNVAVIVEPVLGEGGVVLPPDGYLRSLRDLCNRHSSLLILDEIQTGLGRLGAWWGASKFGPIEPDICLVGKSLSGGVVPVAAMCSKPSVFEPFNRDPLIHTSTFGGQPLALAAAKATIDVIEDEGLVDRAEMLGQNILNGITDIVGDLATVRGAGLLIGIEFREPGLAGEFFADLLMRERVISCHSLGTQKVIRLTPPATLSESDVERLLDSINNSLSRLTK